jgi:hypothetical protein
MKFLNKLIIKSEDGVCDKLELNDKFNLANYLDKVLKNIRDSLLKIWANYILSN